jgi:hypothetical protein
MDAGAPPRGGRGRVLWLVTIEVSCRVDLVRVWWAGVGGAAVSVGGLWAEMVGKFGLVGPIRYELMPAPCSGG